MKIMNSAKSVNPFCFGIEGGGTKYKIILANHPTNIIAHLTIPTTSPKETIQKCRDFIVSQTNKQNIKISAIGIGQFGPVQVDRNASDYGTILNTPKTGWQGINIISELRQFTDLPIVLDTDVNTAALAEHAYGAARGLSDFLYLTIGTGIGGGVIINGRIVHGLLHPEIGHVSLPHDLKTDPFKGNCPFHKDCFEGLASGSAIHARFNKSPKEIPPSHPFWDLEAKYIGQVLANLFFTINSQKFILGGGVMQQNHLFPKIRSEFIESINNYYDVDKTIRDIESFIQPPLLKSDSGCIGAILLAQKFS